MKYVIVGRTGSGKSALADILAANGLDLLKSCTTRAPRSEEDKTRYTFLSREQADAIPDEEKVLPTTLNGELYFSSSHALELADVMILDPKGLMEICALYPDTSFHAVHVVADYDKSAEHACRRADDPEKAMEIFRNRYRSESEQFDKFEAQCKNGDHKDWPENLAAIQNYNNDFTQNCAQAMAEYLLHYKKQHDNITALVQQCADLDILSIPKEYPDKVTVWMNEDSEHPAVWPRHLSPERFADVVIRDDEGLASLVRAWCGCGIHLGIPDELQPVE